MCNAAVSRTTMMFENVISCNKKTIFAVTIAVSCTHLSMLAAVTTAK